MKLFKFRAKHHTKVLAENKLKAGVYFSTDDDDFLDLENPYNLPQPISRHSKTKDMDDSFLFI